MCKSKPLEKGGGIGLMYAESRRDAFLLYLPVIYFHTFLTHYRVQIDLKEESQRERSSDISIGAYWDNFKFKGSKDFTSK